MKTLRILFIGCALLLTHLLAAQSYLQDTIPQTVVTATGTQHLLKDVPVQTEVITSKMLENYAGRSLEDIHNSTMIEKGLLELPTIRQVWMNHTQDAINGEPLDYYHSKNPE